MNEQARPDVMNRGTGQTHAAGTESAAPVLRAQGLRKVYRQGPQPVEVLRGVDLSLAPGEHVAILGASGSGKSTLLHCLAGLERPTSGSVFWGADEPMRLSERKRGLLRNRKLGFVYQFHHLLGEFSALENVALPLMIANLSTQQATEKARDMLERVGLGPRIDHKPSELSGGERQRAALARALVTAPDVILADEPTGNLDRKTAEEVFALILRLNREVGTSLIMVTHDLELAARADQVLRLEDGVLAKVAE